MISSRQGYTSFLNHENFVFLKPPPHVWWWELYLIHSRPIWYDELIILFIYLSESVWYKNFIWYFLRVALILQWFRIYLSIHTDDVMVNSRCQERTITLTTGSWYSRSKFLNYIYSFHCFVPPLFFYFYNKNFTQF